VNTDVAKLIEGAVRRAHIAERLRCANIVAMYPLEGFCYDTNNHGEILRLRDTLSEAILKQDAGERLR
jgi:hypothetical protein